MARSSLKRGNPKMIFGLYLANTTLFQQDHFKEYRMGRSNKEGGSHVFPWALEKGVITLMGAGVWGKGYDVFV